MMKKNMLKFFLLFLLLGGWINTTLMAEEKNSTNQTSEEKIKLTKETSENNSSSKTMEEQNNAPTTLVLKKKDLWLAVGMSTALAGSGHFYVGKYSAGSIFFMGSYGLMAAGILSFLSAHSTRDIVVTGTTVREEDRNVQALSIVGGLFFTSGLIFYIGSVIDIFLEISEYNRRIDRLQRYSQKVSFLLTPISRPRDQYYFTDYNINAVFSYKI